MKDLLKIAIGLASMLFLISCAYDIDTKGGLKGNGAIVKENRKVIGFFDTIIASENLQVYVSQGDEYKVNVEADENIIELIGTDVKDGKLQLHTRQNIGRATKKVYVSLPKISALKSSTSSILQTQNTIIGDSLLLEASTGSILQAEFRFKVLVINGKEGATLNISGISENAEVNVSSGSKIDAEEFQATNCSASASYGGNVIIKVSKSLRADANTGGNISYIGEPEIDKTKSLSGNVQKY